MTTPPHPEAAWITSREMLATWFASVADGDIVGLDTEFTRRNTFHPQLSLLQLGHHERYALVDPLAFDLGDVLEGELGQRPLTCVMHSAGEDLETLAPWLPHGPATLFDTQIAAAFAGLGQGPGYRALVEQLCGVELDKGETRSDWNRRPLTDSQKRYATLDVVYLQQLHDTLSERLQQRDRHDWFAADCERLKRRAETDTPPDQPQRELRAAAGWPMPQQALLRRILLWRERAAREHDKPRTWLLDNAHALELARNPPQDKDQLAQATRGQRALRGVIRHQLLDALLPPIDADEIALTAPVPGRPDPQAKHALRDMKQCVDEQAGKLDLPAGLLCPRKALDAYIATRRWPATLEDWRRDLLLPRLEPLLPD
ncbi:MAG TPA: HRDC domain-containing protein [Oleiagrimonas sp.]|nr:HRDC domain-containing protein [Oleiagrimonas sp.]